MPTPPPPREKVEKILENYIRLRGPERAWHRIAPIVGYRNGRDLKYLLDKFCSLYNLSVPPRRFEAMNSLERARVEDECGSLGVPVSAPPAGAATAPPPTRVQGLVSVPHLPSGEVPVSDLIETLKASSAAKIEAFRARSWVQVPVKVEGPLGFVLWGDPHLDDPGCDWDTLDRHVATVRNNERLLSVCLGDYNNNWVGRLAKLYAHHTVTGKQSWELVKWFINSIHLVVSLKGNHNLWSGDGDPLDFILNGDDVISEDWRCKVEFLFPNGAAFRMWCAHDFPGNSMWNPLHANQRKAVMSGARAHFYGAGHRHQWGLAQHEDPESNHIYWLARARGYKVVDPYATNLGYEPQLHGHSIAIVIDPANVGNPARFVQCFADVEEGADYLAWKVRHGQ